MTKKDLKNTILDLTAKLQIAEEINRRHEFNEKEEVINKKLEEFKELRFDVDWEMVSDSNCNLMRSGIKRIITLTQRY